MRLTRQDRDQLQAAADTMARIRKATGEELSGPHERRLRELVLRYDREERPRPLGLFSVPASDIESA